jgi:hypothetical protein
MPIETEREVGAYKYAQYSPMWPTPRAPKTSMVPNLDISHKYSKASWQGKDFPTGLSTYRTIPVAHFLYEIYLCMVYDVEVGLCYVFGQVCDLIKMTMQILIDSCFFIFFPC